MNFRIKWIYFIRHFQRQRGNGELEFRSFKKIGFVDVGYQDLLDEIIARDSITHSEWFALTDQRIIESGDENKRRAATS